MRDMAPVKFQGKDGQTLAVGDLVWAKRGREAVWGCVTGFDFVEDSLSGVDVTVANPDYGARTSKFDLDDVFRTEKEAYHSILEDLQTQRDGLSREAVGLDNQIVKLRLEWGEEEPE